MSDLFDTERAWELCGAMLASPDVIPEVMREVEPADFGDGEVRRVYDAISRIMEQGGVPDPLLIRDELKAPDLVLRLMSAMRDSTVVPSNAALHARRLRALAMLRAVRDAGLELERVEPTDDPAEVIAAASEALRLAGQDVPSIDAGPAELMREAEAEEESVSRDEIIRTGLPSLDRMLGGGLYPSRLYVLGARTGIGKALALDTPLPTPTGWTTMGEVEVGAELVGCDGRPTRVLAVSEVQQDRPCYEVAFSDGTTIVADAEHLWFTTTRASRRAEQARRLPVNRESPFSRDQRFLNAQPGLVTTREMARTLRVRGYANHAIRLAEPLACPRGPLPIPPYVLGAWLGDGTSATGAITSADPEVILNIETCGFETTKLASKYGYGILGLRARLRRLGVLGNKHIPVSYLRAHEDDRRELLAGLLDTDGTVTPAGAAQFAVTSRQLAADVRELIASLGYRVGESQKPVKGRRPESSICYTLSFSPSDKVFRLSRKLARQCLEHSRTSTRFIVSVRPVSSVPVKCVRVEAADGLFLASRSFIPTHNSALATNIVRLALDAGSRVLFVSLEMTGPEVLRRLVAEKYDLDHADLAHLIEAWNSDEVQAWPLHFMGLANVSTLAMAARRLRAQGLRLVVVDYVQLLPTTGKFERRDLEIGYITRTLKLLAVELGIPVLAISQVNRGADDDKPPRLANLRESGNLEQDANVCLLLHRQPDKPEKKSEAVLAVAKNRHGTLGPVHLRYLDIRCRFREAAYLGGVA